jgi:hypothetical protein
VGRDGPRRAASSASSRRRATKSDYSRTLPGAPDGSVIQQYASAFENEKEAVEHVVLMKEKDGSWKSSATSS